MNDLYRLCRIMGTFDLATGHVETMSEALDALEEELRDVLGHLRGRREWVSLKEDEMSELIQALEDAVYLLNPTEEDMQKKAGAYRVVTALEKLYDNCRT